MKEQVAPFEGVESQAADAARTTSVSLVPAEAMRDVFAGFWRHFPTLDRHIDGVVPEAYRTFCARFDLVERDDFGRATYFAELLERVYQTRREELPACFLDVVRFDLAMTYAATLGYAGEHALASATGGRYATARGLSLQPFDYDVCLLRTGSRAAALARTPCTIAFVPAPSRAQVTAYRLDPVVEAMVRRAVPSANEDELVTSAAIASHTGEGRPGLRARVLHELASLVAAGVLVRVAG